jgi:hypothetical protein
VISLEKILGGRLFFIFTYKLAVHMFSGYLPIIEFSLLAIPPSKHNLLTKRVIFFNIVVLRLTVGRRSLTGRGYCIGPGLK